VPNEMQNEQANRNVSLPSLYKTANRKVHELTERLILLEAALSDAEQEIAELNNTLKETEEEESESRGNDEG
jgi:hypothetical protein